MAQVYGAGGVSRCSGPIHPPDNLSRPYQVPGQGQGRRNMARPQSAGPRPQQGHSPKGASPGKRRERPQSGAAARRDHNQGGGGAKELAFKEGKVGWCSSSMAQGAVVE